MSSWNISEIGNPPEDRPPQRLRALTGGPGRRSGAGAGRAEGSAAAGAAGPRLPLGVPGPSVLLEPVATPVGQVPGSGPEARIQREGRVPAAALAGTWNGLAEASPIVENSPL